MNQREWFELLRQIFCQHHHYRHKSSERAILGEVLAVEEGFGVKVESEGARDGWQDGGC